MTIDRIAELITPLPPVDGTPALLFSNLRGYDAVSECFRFEVSALASDPNIVANDILGEMVTLKVATNEDEPDQIRYFHGMVDQFRFDGNDEEGWFKYRLVLRPKFWLLSKTTDNRIFQEMTATDIITQLLDEHGVTDYELSLRGSPETREYCVQYGESDLDFIQRLMEHEGIFYYFKFEDGKHTLMLSDDPVGLAAAEGAAELRFEPNLIPGLEGIGVITRLERADTIVSGQHTLTDYNFETPSADLAATMQNPKGHSGDGMERYHYPGRYLVQGHGDTLVGLRNEEDQALAHRIWADSTASMPASGHLFTLYDYPRDAENLEYMILRVEYDIWDGQYSAGGRDTPEGFAGRYAMVPSDAYFRPARITPKPVMKGPQTAIVVGPSGEEIYTDQYARVKVQFYWDREGQRDENSTCFIRVSSAWAGSGWGFIQIPRIGQEVIVDFLDGDPDRPIITGRVYNAEQMPPYDLPGNATQSGWKSNSSKGGGGWNELRFEDLAGSEEVYFQAQKDHTEWIKNNETRNIDNDFAETVGNDAKQDVVNNRDETVGNNKTTAVGVNRDVNIGSNDTETVGQNRSLTVGVDETIVIGANSTETIGANHSQTVGSNQTVTVAIARVDTVGAAETRTVGAAQINTIGAMRQVSVGAAQSHDVGVNDSWEIGSNQSVSVGNDQSVTVGKNHSLTAGENSTVNVAKMNGHTVGEDMTVEVGKNFQLTAADSITLICGKAKLQMKKDGTFLIQGKDIEIDGSGKIDIKAKGDITMTGSKINQN